MECYVNRVSIDIEHNDEINDAAFFFNFVCEVLPSVMDNGGGLLLPCL